jgi:hypothetical protein
MRVVVTGGRDYKDEATLERVLTQHGITELAQGGAVGADWLAEDWAIKNKIPWIAFPAKWDELGKAAGSIRNQFMLEEFKPEAVIAFPGGKGTADCVRRARKMGIRVIFVSVSS